MVGRRHEVSINVLYAVGVAMVCVKHAIDIRAIDERRSLSQPVRPASLPEDSAAKVGLDRVADTRGSM